LVNPALVNSKKYRSAIAAIPPELPYDAPNHCCFLHIWFTIVWRYVGNGWELLNDSPDVCIRHHSELLGFGIWGNDASIYQILTFLNNTAALSEQASGDSD